MNNNVIKQSLWGFGPSVGTAQKEEHLGLSGLKASMYLRRGSLCRNLKDEQKRVGWQAERGKVKAEGGLMQRNRKLKKHRMFLKLKAVQHCWRLKLKLIGDDQLTRGQTDKYIIV